MTVCSYSIKPSKYAAFSAANSIIRHININEYGKDKVITVWLKDKDGEFYLPSFTVPEVEYEYRALFINTDNIVTKMSSLL